MREYLFRGKSIVADTPNTPGYWIEGYLIGTEYAYHIVTSNNTYIDLDCDSEVWPETVGQWTGLLDAKGKKIFEGDIVRNNYGRAKVVKFFNGRYIPFNAYPEYNCWSENECKVVGNIHDNPEFLKGE